MMDGQQINSSGQAGVAKMMPVTKHGKVEIRPLKESDLPQADRIFRIAFGTFLGLQDPASFAGDADYVCSRWRSAPHAALGAFLEQELVASNFAANWGSFGFFGPLTVRPDLWDRGIARALLEETVALFEEWGTRVVGLFTLPQSPKHIGLYRAFGFWPQSLTPVMSKAVRGSQGVEGWSIYSALPPADRAGCLAACVALTEMIFPGLDLRSEIRTVESQNLGDTVLLHRGAELVAFAVCHVGMSSEAGSGAAYVKFGAVRPGSEAAKDFARLLSACEAFARIRGQQQLIAGVNMARKDAFQAMFERGFRTVLQGVAMQRSNEIGFNRPDCFVIDDWR